MGNESPQYANRREYGVDIVQQITAKVRVLPLECQGAVLAFVEELESKGQGGPRRSSYGSCADIRTDLSFSEFTQNRREMWGQSTDTELDP